MKYPEWMTKVAGMVRGAMKAEAQRSHDSVVNSKTVLDRDNALDQADHDEEKVMLAAGWTHLSEPEVAQMESAIAQANFDPSEERIKGLEGQIRAWSGADIREIEQLDPMGIYDIAPDLLEREQLRSTVPDEYRGEVFEAFSAPSDPTEGGMNSFGPLKASATIIAIDQTGQALVQQYVCDNYLGAEGWSFDTLPAGEAYELIDNYRASHDLVKIFGNERGWLPTNFDYANPAGGIGPEAATLWAQAVELRARATEIASWGAPPEVVESLTQQAERLDESVRSLARDAPTLASSAVQLAQSGHTYRGRIQAVEQHHALQRDSNGGGLIRHDLRTLVGVDLAVGDVAEIRYPYGQIGLVSRQDALEREGLEQASEHGLGPHQNQQEFER